MKNIRKDFLEVEGNISTLINIGGSFKSMNNEWIYLKCDYDYYRVSALESKETYKIELIYSKGRDMALDMSYYLMGINSNFTEFPTITSIVEFFEGQCNHYMTKDHEIHHVAMQTCKKLSVRFSSIELMYALYEKQLNLIRSIKSILNSIKHSSIYKRENGMPEKDSNSERYVINNSNGVVTINSSNSKISNSINSDHIFTEMLEAINKHGLSKDESLRLRAEVEELRKEKGGKGFATAFNSFIQNTSGYLGVFGPFLTTLSSYIS